MSRSRHHTGWAGALGFAAELSRRGYDAAITLGNTPALDLICSSPGEVSFTVQVKSMTTGNWVLIKKSQLEGPPRGGLYFAIVLVPADDDQAFVYHIMTQAEVCEAYCKQSPVKKDGTAYKPGMEGLAWGDVSPHRGRWGKLPE